MHQTSVRALNDSIRVVRRRWGAPYLERSGRESNPSTGAIASPEAEILLMQELLIERGYPRVERTSMSQMRSQTKEGKAEQAACAPGIAHVTVQTKPVGYQEGRAPV